MDAIECLKCGVKNRIGSKTYKQIPLCGRCGTQLPESASVRSIRALVRLKYWIILIVVTGGGWFASEMKHDAPVRQDLSVTSSQPPTRATSASPIELLTPVPIAQGVIDRLAPNGIAPLAIVTPAGEESYYVKLIDTDLPIPVMTIFIGPGQHFETEVPLGSYKLRYATGKTWYGEEHLFGPNTAFNEAEKEFVFEDQGNQVSGFTVELIKQRSGNLHTRKLTATQF